MQQGDQEGIMTSKGIVFSQCAVQKMLGIVQMEYVQNRDDVRDPRGYLIIHLLLGWPGWRQDWSIK